jgi:hypothetical protein
LKAGGQAGGNFQNSAAEKQVPHRRFAAVRNDIGTGEVKTFGSGLSFEIKFGSQAPAAASSQKE